MKNSPMVLHWYRSLIINRDSFDFFNIWNSIIKDDILKQMSFFRFNLLLVHCMDLKVQQVSFPNQLDLFWGVIVAGNNDFLPDYPRFLRDKAHKYLLAFLGVDVELNWIYHEML